MTRLPTFIRICALLGLLAAAAACETIVEVDPPHHDPQLVAHGFFSADSLWMVQVTHSVPHTARTDPGVVLGATVEIWTPGGLVQSLSPSDSGRFVARNLQAHRDTTYTLRVSAPGYDDVEGSDRLPTRPVVVSFEDSSLLDEGMRTVRMQLEIKDPAGAPNFYGLAIAQASARVHQSAGSVNPLPPRLYTFESDDPVLESVLSDYLDPELRRYRSAFFSDETFDGSRKAIDLSITYPPLDTTQATQTLRAFVVILVSASEHLYRHWTTADRQLTGNENPFAEPIRVHSNMSNELGVFAGFQSHVQPLRAANEEVIAACETLAVNRVDCRQIVTHLPIGIQKSFFSAMITH